MNDGFLTMDSGETTQAMLDGLLCSASPRVRSTHVPTIFEVERLSVSYGNKRVLRNISLDIPEKRITSFIGPSGCGKSTALRCLNRMNDEISSFSMTGEIRLAGQNIRDKSVNITALRRSVGMVFQQPNPFPMSIFDNIALAVREHNGRMSSAELGAVVEEALRHACLWDEVKDSLREPGLSLSGGQQQRLCIARALAVKPAVIMLDEPCASLDPISTAKIEDLLLRLSEDYSIVIVTHNMAQAKRISDKTAFFLMGELVEYGDALQVFEAPTRTETGDYVLGVFG